MYRLFILIVLFVTVFANAQNVGIGTTTPLALLHVSDSSVLFTGPISLSNTPGNTPVSGMGNRMMYYAAKSAFRVGFVGGNDWDKDSIGQYSFAAGYNPKAKGTVSMAFGNSTKALEFGAAAFGSFTTAMGQYATAMGFGTTAMGQASTATGTGTTAMGQGSIATGESTIAIGQASTAMGYQTISSGDFSTSIGYTSKASGFASTAIGAEATASGDYATSIGLGTVARALGSIALGIYNDSISTSPNSAGPTSPIFIIGNGVHKNARSNAITVLRNGNTGIGKNDPAAKLHINGNGSLNQLILENNTENIVLRLSNDGGGSGAYIGTSSNHSFSLVSSNTVRAVITSTGIVDVKNNLTVQNGKGIIRNVDGTQQKKLTTNVAVTGGFNAGETKTFGITWPETFGGTPEAFVGNVVSGTGGWAEMVLTIGTVNASGAILYVYNPITTAVNPSFSIKIIGIGPQ